MRKHILKEIIVRPAPGKPTEAIIEAGSLAIRAAIGKGGRSIFKREGDGCTPIASMRILSGYYRADRHISPVTSLKMRPILGKMLWCDEKFSANYNRPVRAPFARSHERMMRDDGLYDICLILDWNLNSRKQGCGSAIFFHLAREGYAPTEGCVAIKKRDMLRLIGLVSNRTVVRVVSS